MNVLIQVSGGTGVATWEGETGVEFEVDVGEISSDWLDNHAEAHFGKMIGEDVTIEVIDLDEGEHDDVK